MLNIFPVDPSHLCWFHCCCLTSFLGIVGVQYSISFRCTIKWFNILYLTMWGIPRIMVIICYYANLFKISFMVDHVIKFILLYILYRIKNRNGGIWNFYIFFNILLWKFSNMQTSWKNCIVHCHIATKRLQLIF